MMGKFNYDIIVIGGGAAGFVASKLAAGLGRRVALVEKRKLGGECTLFGCVPSKALIKTANVAFQMKRLKSYGLDTEAGISLKTDRVMDHVRSVVQKVYSGHPPEMFRGLGIDVLFGNPAFIDNHSIDLDGKRISSRSFIISTGSSAFIPPIEGINTVPYLTNETFFDIEKLPSSVIVLGGGPIGIELASAMNRLGVSVTVVEMADTILFREDRELAGILSGTLKEEGLELLTGTKAVKLSISDGQVVLSAEDNRKLRRDITAGSVLVAVGRKANVEGLKLENAGVQYDLKGVKVDERLRTTAPNIYACGDVAGPYQFSHMAEYQARIAVQNAVFPWKKKADYRHAAWCTFTDPELARAGMTEEEARKDHGGEIRIYRWEYRNTDRGKTDLSETGMGKYIVDGRGRLIGIHILGPHAGEIIHEALLAKRLGVPFHKLDSLIHIYPTFSDIVKQPAKLAHIDKIRNNPFLKLIRTLTGN